METLCSIDRIAFMDNYIWVIEGIQFRELQSAKSEKMIFSELYFFNSRNTGNVSFVFNLMRKANGSTSTAIGVQIKSTNFSVDGRWSVMVEEVGYIRNDIRF